MTPKDDKPLSTADLARTPDRALEEVRGVRDEPIIAREALDQPAIVTNPPALPADAIRREAERPPRAVEPERTKPVGSDTAPNTPLFAEHDASDLRRRWSDVQAGFVDEPRRAVEQADSLVAEVMKRLAQGFANERTTLEHQWDRGDNVTTEDLRVTLQRYRSFFVRLLEV